MPHAGIIMSYTDAESAIDEAVAASREVAAHLPTKCESCGSREWRPHDGKEVCAYCRSDR